MIGSQFERIAIEKLEQHFGKEKVAKLVFSEQNYHDDNLIKALQKNLCVLPEAIKNSPQIVDFFSNAPSLSTETDKKKGKGLAHSQTLLDSEDFRKIEIDLFIKQTKGEKVQEFLTKVAAVSFQPNNKIDSMMEYNVIGEIGVDFSENFYFSKYNSHNIF